MRVLTPVAPARLAMRALVVGAVGAFVIGSVAGASVVRKGGIEDPKFLGSRVTDDGVGLRVYVAPASDIFAGSNIPESCFPDTHVLVGVSTDRIAETMYTALFRARREAVVHGTGGPDGRGGVQVVVVPVSKRADRVRARFSDGTVDEASRTGKWAVLARETGANPAVGRSARTRTVDVTVYDRDGEVLQQTTVRDAGGAGAPDVSRPECRPQGPQPSPVPPPSLPEPVGPPPADEATARAEVIATFERTYGAGGDPDASLQNVQDGDHAAVRTAQEAAAKTGAQYAGKVRAEVEEVVFVDADEAAVRFSLVTDEQTLVPSRIGFAVLTADGWKVTRSTHCGVLAPGGGRC